MPRKVDRFNVDGEDYVIEPVLDAVPTQGSVNGVESGGVYSAMQQDKTSVPMSGDNRNFTANGAALLELEQHKQSVQGLYWKYVNSNISGRFTAFGSDNFVVVDYVANTNRIQYSPDGETWHEATVNFTPTNGYYNQVAYGENGNFVTGHSMGGVILYSDDDGKTWDTATLPGDITAMHIFNTFCYFKGVWVTAGNYGSMTSLYSTDNGHTWQHTTGEVFGGIGISGYFVKSETCIIKESGADANYAFLRSTDGINWTGFNLPSLGAGRQGSVSYAGGAWFICHSGLGGGLYRSTDEGITWTRVLVTDDGNNVLYKFGWVAELNGCLFANSYGGTSDALFVSTDNGANWMKTGVTVPSSSYLRKLGGILVAGCWAGLGGNFMRSVDGLNWEQTTVTAAIRFMDIAYGKGKYVATQTITNSYIPMVTV